MDIEVKSIKMLLSEFEAGQKNMNEFLAEAEHGNTYFEIANSLFDIFNDSSKILNKYKKYRNFQKYEDIISSYMNFGINGSSFCVNYVKVCFNLNVLDVYFKHGDDGELYDNLRHFIKDPYQIQKEINEIIDKCDEMSKYSKRILQSRIYNHMSQLHDTLMSLYRLKDYRDRKCKEAFEKEKLKLTKKHKRIVDMLKFLSKNIQTKENDKNE